MAGTGGKRVGAGRPKGQPNKATADLKAFAQQHSKEAIEAIVKLMKSEDTPPQTKLAAASALLDRAHGRPAQAVMNEDGSKLFPEKIEVVLVKPKG